MTGILFIALASLLAGFNLAALKFALIDLSPPLLMLIRFASATLFLWFFFKPKWEKNLLKISFLSAFSLVFVILGLNLSVVSNVQVILAFIPLGAGIVAHFLLNEKQSFKSLVGMLLGLIGTFILIFEANLTGADGQALALGNGLIFLAAICQSFYIVACRKISKTSSTTAVVFNQFSATTILFLLLSLVFLALDYPLLISPPSTTSLLSLGYLVIFGTVAMFLLSQAGLKRTSAYLTGMGQYLQVPVGIFAGVIFLADRISSIFIFGTALILLGSFLGVREHWMKAKIGEAIGAVEQT